MSEDGLSQSARCCLCDALSTDEAGRLNWMGEEGPICPSCMDRAAFLFCALLGLPRVVSQTKDGLTIPWSGVRSLIGQTEYDLIGLRWTYRRRITPEEMADREYAWHRERGRERQGRA